MLLFLLVPFLLFLLVLFPPLRRRRCPLHLLFLLLLFPHLDFDSCLGFFHFCEPSFPWGNCSSEAPRARSGLTNKDNKERCRYYENLREESEKLEPYEVGPPRD